MPSSWTWIWNCGGNGSQYQSETPSGYQQINANVAIRISSPGNDGNVTQINLGARASVVVPTPTRIVPPIPPRGVSAPSVGSLPSAASVPSLAQALIAALGPPEDASTRPASDIALVPIPQSAPVSTIPPAPTTALAPAAPKPGLLGSLGATGLPAGAGLRAAWAEGGTARPYADAAALARETAAAWAADGSQPARPTASLPAASPAESKPVASAPRWRPPLPEPAVPAPLSGVSAAAATGGGGSSGTGLLFLLALPFVAALLDLARRVALEHATWPPGHRRRPPDRPG